VNVPAIVVDKIESEAGHQPGAIELRDLEGRMMGIAFRCPCGCGYTSWLPVTQEDRGWEWDGNREAPTLTPSILQSGLPCKWHGYLTAGEFRPC